MVTYETEFKEKAVKMTNQISAAKAARNPDIHVNTLYTWISRAKSQGQVQSVPKSTHSTDSGDAAELLKRIKELEKSKPDSTGCPAFFRSGPKVATKSGYSHLSTPNAANLDFAICVRYCW